MSQLCPRGMEATMFALLAGCHNLGATISSNFGAVPRRARRHRVVWSLRSQGYGR